MIDEVAEVAAAISFAELPQLTQQAALLSLFYNISVGIAGVDPAAVPDQAPATGGPHRLLDGRRTADTRAAAFCNGMTMHARAQDDVLPGVAHVGTVVIPALMAAAERHEVDGARFLDALVTGYAVSRGLARRHGAKLMARGFRTTPIFATFGAAAAVARVMGLSQSETAHSLGLVTSFNIGYLQTWLDASDEWRLQAGLAAEAAVRSADLAAAGLTAATRALDGPKGFFAVLAGEQVSFADLAEDFDPVAAVTENVLKRYPVGGICQSVVLAAEKAAARIGVADRVVRVRLEMNPWDRNYSGNLNYGPFRGFPDRLMSAPLCVASVLRHGKYDFGQFCAEADADLEALLGRIVIDPDPELASMSSRLTVELTDGSGVVVSADALTEGGITWDQVAQQTLPLWAEGGRSSQEHADTLAAVAHLHRAPKAEFLALDGPRKGLTATHSKSMISYCTEPNNEVGCRRGQ